MPGATGQVLRRAVVHRDEVVVDVEVDVALVGPDVGRRRAHDRGARERDDDVDDRRPSPTSLGVGDTIVSLAVDAGRVTLVVEPEAAADGAALGLAASELDAPASRARSPPGPGAGRGEREDERSGDRNSSHREPHLPGVMSRRKSSGSPPGAVPMTSTVSGVPAVVRTWPTTCPGSSWFRATGCRRAARTSRRSP